MPEQGPKKAQNAAIGANFLTLEEIHKLISSSVDAKINIAKNVAKYYDGEESNDKQIKIAEQVFRTLLKDTETQVRKALSESVKHLHDIPYDVVVSLARDVTEVSLPVLEFSEILTDADLIDIISSAEHEQKHIAITKRKNIASKVSDALIDTKNEKIVDNVIKNKGAELSEHGYTKIVSHHGGSEEILSSMIERGSLPVTIVESIANTISSELYNKLCQKHKDSMDTLRDAINKSRDVATMQVMGLESSEEEFRSFSLLMKKLKISEELIPISALCMANINLFEISLAKRVKIPVLNVRKLLGDSNNQGFKALYGRASIPMHLYDASLLLFETVNEIGPNTLSRIGKLRLAPESVNRLIEALMVKAEEQGEPIGLDFLLSLIKHDSEGN